MSESNPSRPLKLLINGDVNGKFNSLYKRVVSIQSNQSVPFDMLFCVGNFFGSDMSQWLPYKSGKKQTPITTYVLGANKEGHAVHFMDDDGCDLAENISYLGRQGIFTTSSGLTVAYLSGLDGGDKSDFNHFSKSDVNKLADKITQTNGFTGVDILLTSVWPAGVSNYGVELSAPPQFNSNTIAELAVRLRPRYHFTALEGINYERNPYRNHQVLSGSQCHVTRFVSLAHVGNKEKSKYMFAFNIVPMKYIDKQELHKQPGDVTEIPYKIVPPDVKEVETGGAPARNEFFYGAAKPGDQKHSHKRSRDSSGGPDKKTPRTPCWFCLASPEVEKHLVVSIADSTYLALAKGGLDEQHVLILPIDHSQSQVTCNEEVTKEIEQYKKAVEKLFRSQNKVPIFFERNYKSQHAQVQCVGIPTSKTPIVKEIFLKFAEQHGIELAEIPERSDLKQIVPAGRPYLYVELPDNEKLFCRIELNRSNQNQGGRDAGNTRFPLQFAREVLADQRLLNVPGGDDWRAMSKTKQEETEIAKSFQKRFKPYDFNAL